jgi:phytoene/squalene synthetase
MDNEFKTSQRLAVSITRSASMQTAYTIRFLADRDLMSDAYKAYAYFRWVDDSIDQESLPREDRLDFINRQSALIIDFSKGVRRPDITAQENMLAELIQRAKADPEHDGLKAYIQNMMAVMTFDVGRRGRLISKRELTDYAHTLAVAVTEAMHYFIGHNSYSPTGETRYLAVTGAHITHMLRDTLEDNAAGYFNIPDEYLRANHISPMDVCSDPYRQWIKSRVELARSYFKAGRDYMAQVENTRCRLAGYAYMARFEAVLDLMEVDDFLLRANYKECKTPIAGLRMSWSTLSSVFNEKSSHVKPGALTVR